MTYGAILADPPWTFLTWSAKGRGRSPDGQGHYKTLTFEEIATWPLANIAADDCVLFLWTTDPMLTEALTVGQRWGFDYKTIAFVWVKQTKTGKRWHMGMGHWTRSNPELCLLFTRGKPKRLSASVRKLIEAPVREHSRKPDEVYDSIEELVAGPYLELFARTPRLGWDQHGDQLGQFGATAS
jgi:N6-adenosine-specific RNA methylase IME4